MLLMTVVLLTGCDISWLQFRAPGSRDRRADAALLEGRGLLAQGLTAEALAAFRNALADNPRLTDAHLGVGDVHMQMGDDSGDATRTRRHWVEASKAYERAVQLEPNSFEAHFKLARVYQYLDRVQQSIRLYLMALALKPDDPDANENLAAAYLQAGRPADALPFAERATELRPGRQSAWGNLGQVYRLLDQHEDAVDAFREAMELGQPQPRWMLALAQSHLKLRNYARAENVLRTVTRIAPSPEAHERLGYALFNQQRFGDALDAFNAALEMAPRDVAALNGRGACYMTVYMQNGRADRTLRDRGIEAWRASLRIDPDQPKIINLITVYQRM